MNPHGFVGGQGGFADARDTFAGLGATTQFYGDHRKPLKGFFLVQWVLSLATFEGTKTRCHQNFT